MCGFGPRALPNALLLVFSCLSQIGVGRLSLVCVVEGGIYFEVDQRMSAVLPGERRNALVMVLLPYEPELPPPAMCYRTANCVPKR
jgi:hypothetical protein|eukprot:1582337-Prymnesium_polylepis.1